MKTGRVLLADSHLNMLEGVHSLLETLFETVVMVADERSLIGAVATLMPDLVVVDLSLPVAEGANIARQLQARYPALRIIVLSVYDEPAVAPAARTALPGHGQGRRQFGGPGQGRRHHHGPSRHPGRRPGHRPRRQTRLRPGLRLGQPGRQRGRSTGHPVRPGQPVETAH